MTTETQKTSQKVGRYSIARHVAADEGSDVYLAYENGDPDHPIALRILSGRYGRDKELLRAFRQAIESTSRLNHEYIARIMDVGVTAPGAPYVAMDFAPCCFLRTYLEDNEPLPAAKALDIVISIAEALTVALRSGSPHHDLRPGNVILNADEKPILLGLDTPTLFGNEDAAAPYWSPEQREGKVLDARSNVYSLGAILYELLAGFPPSYDEEGAPEPLEEVRDGLATRTYDIVRKSLRTESWARFQTMQEMLNALREAQLVELPGDELAEVQTAPIAARAQTRTGQARPRREKRASGWMWVLALFLLLSFLGCGLISAALLVNSESLQPIIGEREAGAGQDLQGATQPASDAPPPQVGVVTRDAGALVTATTPTATSETIITLLPTPTLMATATSQDTVTQDTVTEEPEPVTREPGTVTATQLTTPPTIDGELSDWFEVSLATSEFIVYTAPGWDGTEDLSARWQLAWDEEQLYVGVVVTDDVHVQTQNGSAIYRGDSLEMQFDTNRETVPQSTLSPNNFQLLLSPGNFDTLAPEAFRFQGTFTNELASAPEHNVTVAAQRTGEGYVLEAAIPWADIAVTPSQGLRLGLALNANDNDAPGTAVQEVMMSNVSSRTLTNPSTWGTLTLE